jgi:hypothetical protein
VYPNAGISNSWDLDYSIVGIPWQSVNIARFQIDGQLSNGFIAAGGTIPAPFPAGSAGSIRAVQELSVVGPIKSNVALVNGTFHDVLHIDPLAVTLYWITPYDPNVAPPTPGWINAVVEAGNVILRWEPNTQPSFYSYEVRLGTGDGAVVVSPVPLRAAMWIDTAPPPGRRTYTIRALTASGVYGGPMVAIATV